MHTSYVPMDHLTKTESLQPHLPIEAPPEPPTIRRLFLGDDGLRAGWSVLLFVLLLVGISLLGNFLITHFHLLPKSDPKAPQPKEGTFHSLLIGEGLSFLIIAFVAWIMSLHRTSPLYPLRLRPQDACPPISSSALGWGVLCLSLLVGTMVSPTRSPSTASCSTARTALIYAAKWLFGFLLVGLLEEFLFRGYPAVHRRPRRRRHHPRA